MTYNMSMIDLKNKDKSRKFNQKEFQTVVIIPTLKIATQRYGITLY